MRTLRFTIATLLAASIIFAGAVQAQVAAPRLNPIKSDSNPAVVPWSEASRVGVGFIESSNKSGTPLTETSTGEGFTGQFRFVGENFAFHAVMATLEST
ncbi:MAG: hypothetical protein V3S64_08365, partial [bacterium]